MMPVGRLKPRGCTQEEADKKACPFGVAEHCVGSACMAWRSAGLQMRAWRYPDCWASEEEPQRPPGVEADWEWTPPLFSVRRHVFVFGGIKTLIRTGYWSPPLTKTFHPPTGYCALLGEPEE